MATKLDTILYADEVKTLREALLIGLASYGEVERLENSQNALESCNREVPEGMRVIHPTGASDTICLFADALRSLNKSCRREENSNG